MSFVLFLLVLSLFVFSNVIFLVAVLFGVSLVSVFYLSINCFISPITAFMLVIVYVGAIIILIGYICAVTPNPSLEPSYNHLLFLFFSFVSLLLLYPDSPLTLSPSSPSYSLDSFFYTSYGLHLLSLIIFILFIILLTSTSQTTVTKGPFRSLF